MFVSLVSAFLEILWHISVARHLKKSLGCKFLLGGAKGEWRL